MTRRPGGDPVLDPFQARLLEDLTRYVEGRAQLPLDDVRPARARRSARRRVLLAAAALLLVAAAAAAAVIAGRPDAQTAAVAGVACADAASDTPDLAIIAADGRPPLEVCAQLWRTRQIAGSSGDVPQLTPCLADSGAIIVYPAGPGICARLGLDPEIPAGYADAGRRINAFRRALVTRLEPTAEGCPSATEAGVLAEEELGRAGLAGWSVEVDTRGVGECASFGMDAARRVVTVTPLPR
ncbi:MAG: hypothetical protein AB7V42_11520 [Thermoleophilia bacterium]